jgi:hypothetical protein
MTKDCSNLTEIRTRFLSDANRKHCRYCNARCKVISALLRLHGTQHSLKHYVQIESRKSGSSVGSYSVWLRAGQPDDRGSIPSRGERIFPLNSLSRPALGPTQSPVQWVPGFLSPGLKRGRGVTLTTHPI